MEEIAKIVLITGGNSGIGEACATKFAEVGYRVLICGRRELECQRVINNLRNHGYKADYFVADLAKSKEITALFNWIIANFTRLDCLINNAAIEGDTFTKTAEYSEASFDKVMAINIKAPWLCMKYALNIMQQADTGGNIVNVSSLAGLRSSITGGCAYTTSKHALIGLTRTAAKEYAASKIRINAVCPAFVYTPLAREVLGEQIETYVKMHPIGRICESHEVANAIYWLCSDESSFITGIALPIDGGVMS